MKRFLCKLHEISCCLAFSFCVHNPFKIWKINIILWSVLHDNPKWMNTLECSWDGDINLNMPQYLDGNSHNFHIAVKTFKSLDIHASQNTFGEVPFTICMFLQNYYTAQPVNPSLYGQHYWWLVRVTLVVDWRFLPQNFGPVVGTYEGILPLWECRCGGDCCCKWWGHLTTLCDNQTFCAPRWWGP